MFAVSFGAPAGLVRATVFAFLIVIPWLAGLAAWSQNFCVVSAHPKVSQDVPATTFTLTGFVRNQNNQSVSGARISVLNENSQSVYSGFVDSSGRFTVKGLRQGRFILRVETTGLPYEENSQNLELQSLRQFGGNEIITVDVILKYKKGNEPPSRASSVFAQDVPKAARSEFERGVNNLKGNKTEPGIASLKKAIELFPDYFDALELLGTEYVKSNQHEAALPLLTHAIEINKRASKSLYALGVMYLRGNHFPEAIETLGKSAQLDSNNPNTQMMLGLAYGNSGTPDKSDAAAKPKAVA